MINTNEINPDMIVLGREFRGFTQTDLAKNSNISQANLSKMELGALAVSDDSLNKISISLNLPIAFFKRKINLFQPNLYYRKLAKSSTKLIRKSVAEMNVHRMAIQSLLKSNELVDKPLPVLSIENYENPENIAIHLRMLWNIPSGPIHELFSTLERQGLFIVLCDFDSNDISGRSMFTDFGYPIIFVNKHMPMDRQRFTTAHELGHLIMHMSSICAEDRDIEKEANLFASAFLMPISDIQHQLIGMSISKLGDLKKYWKSSMSSILVRSFQLGAISTTMYKNLNIELSYRGFKKSEPRELEPEIETPELLSTMIKLHIENLLFDEKDLSELLGLQYDEINNRYMVRKNDKRGKLKLII